MTRKRGELPGLVAAALKRRGTATTTQIAADVGGSLSRVAVPLGALVAVGEATREGLVAVEGRRGRVAAWSWGTTGGDVSLWGER